VVSTACTGPEDLIDSGENGFLLACGDCRGLSDAVVRLLEDDESRARFGRVGREKISHNFSLEVLTDKLIECWDSA
jgi:glycosyltransferase involved in cell wall biosynthesis